MAKVTVEVDLKNHTDEQVMEFADEFFYVEDGVKYISVDEFYLRRDPRDDSYFILKVVE